MSTSTTYDTPYPPSPASSTSSRQVVEAAENMPYIRAPLKQHLPCDTLHERIGGDKVVNKITDTFYDIAEEADALK